MIETNPPEFLPNLLDQDQINDFHPRDSGTGVVLVNNIIRATVEAPKFFLDLFTCHRHEIVSNGNDASMRKATYDTTVTDWIGLHQITWTLFFFTRQWIVAR